MLTDASGKATNFLNGHIMFEKYKIGIDSFSFAFWFRATNINVDPVIISNKNWNNGKNCGFALAAMKHGIHFNVADGVNREDCEFAFPCDFKDGDGWMHIILSVDRTNKTVTCFYDFEEYFTYGIHDLFNNVTFDSLDLCIGQDGTGEYGDPLNADIEDMLIFNHALNTDEVKNLKLIYRL